VVRSQHHRDRCPYAIDALAGSPSDYLAYRWEDATPYFYAFGFAAWLVNGALSACFFGLIVVVAKRGWPDLRELWRLLRLQPVPLLAASGALVRKPRRGSASAGWHRTR
jgi:hypothetical protein